MNIQSRKEAILSGQNVYFTGKACRNGHISYRYVQSGTCYDCINKDRKQSITTITREERLANMANLEREKEASITTKADAIRQFKERKTIVENKMVAVKLRLFPEHREELAAMAFAFAAMRDARLTPDDVHPATKPLGGVDGGTALFQFYCFPEDVAALRAAMTAAQNRQAVDPINVRRTIFKTEAEVNAKVTYKDGVKPEDCYDIEIKT